MKNEGVFGAEGIMTKTIKYRVLNRLDRMTDFNMITNKVRIPEEWRISYIT